MNTMKTCCSGFYNFKDNKNKYIKMFKLKTLKQTIKSGSRTKSPYDMSRILLIACQLFSTLTFT